MPDWSGHDIERYHVIEKLGEGGMAVVYRAFDRRLERDVAFKVIRREEFGKAHLERLLKRFEREAKALARLEHPHIVKIHDYGQHQGSPYLVMPFISGGTLKSLTGAPMPCAEAAHLLAPIADALAYAHEQGIVHRDVKPSNILLGSRMKPMLTDFGIARILDAAEAATLTPAGMGIGTPEYMSPEQGQGLKVDGRSDIYALGVVFYELVTGRTPFKADTPLALVLKHIHDPLPPPTQFAHDLPQEAEQALYKALAKQPEQRYADMAEMTQALERLAHIPSPAQPLHAEKQAASPTAVEEPAAAPLLAVPRRTQPTQKNWLTVGIVALVVFMALVSFAVFAGLISGLLSSRSGLSSLFASSQPTPTATFAPLPTRQEPTVTPVLPEPFYTDTPVFPGAFQSLMDGMTMIYIPAGEFTMGSEAGFSDEVPVHPVYLDPFWIDQTEVTNEMYFRCVAADACTEPENTGSFTRADYYYNPQFANYPVIYVNYYQAQAYCTWAGKSLPTEAQWEKAARGVDFRTYPWGEGIDCSKANYQGCYQETLPVGSFPGGASPYGVLDMAGNVTEWVSDWYDAEYYADYPHLNPAGPSEGVVRVIRAGSWINDASVARTSNREYANEDYSYYDLGFRCVYNGDMP